MIKLAFKDNQIIEVHDYMRYCYFLEENKMGMINMQEYCEKNSCIEILSNFELTNCNGKTNCLVLENDMFIPTYLETFVEFIKDNGINKSRSNPPEIYTNLHPSFLSQIKEKNNTRLSNLSDPRYKNVVISSLFQDRKQFQFIINNLFGYFSECNFFIFSPNLIEVLKEEINNEIYLSHNGKLNELKSVIENNNIYKTSVLPSGDYDIVKIGVNYKKEIVETDKLILLKNNYETKKENNDYDKKSIWE